MDAAVLGRRIEQLRQLAAERGISFSEAEIAAGAEQLESVLLALAEFDRLDVQELEPTTFLCFDGPGSRDD